MPEITLRGHRIEYEVRRSSDATRPRIDIRPSGVRVTVPNGSGVDPEAFLEEKREWVLEKYGEVQAYLDRVPDRDLEEGGTLPVLGRDRVIRVAEGGGGIDGDELRVPRGKVESKDTEEALETVLREVAREKVHAYLSEYGGAVDGGYDTVYIRNQKTKWASCSSKNNLSFNWRLVLGPPEVLEYVVVHELVHLEEQGHSKRFWRRVEEILPNYREYREWLKDNRHRLVFTPEDA